MDRARRTRAEQQQQTRTLLLAAASEVFAESGFEGASIDAITERAGFTRGAFYSNFASKEALLIALSEARMISFAQEILPAILHASREDQLDRVTDWLLEQAPPVELLLLIELGRLRARSDAAGHVIDQLVGGTSTFIDNVIDQAVGLEAIDARIRQQLTSATLALITGIQLMRHIGLPLDTQATRLLLGALLSTGTSDVEANE
jgi:AcrR family transcriptional regulator